MIVGSLNDKRKGKTAVRRNCREGGVTIDIGTKIRAVHRIPLYFYVRHLPPDAQKLFGKNAVLLMLEQRIAPHTNPLMLVMVW